MTALNKLSIPQLISRLNSLGVEWVGSTTRKAPLIATINNVGEQWLNNREVEMVVKGLVKGLNYPVNILMGVLRYWEQTVTSDEVADPHTLQQSVLEIARQKYPPSESLPSLDKVLSYSWEYLKQLNHFQLIGIFAVLEGVTYRGDNKELLPVIKATIAGMRRRPDRNLVFDHAGCQYVYESKTGFQFKIAEDMWENPTKPLYHALVLQDLKQRGFYEPDCVTDALHGLYLVCDLVDAPPSVIQMGEWVRLKPDIAPVDIEGLPQKKFGGGSVGKIVGFQGTEIVRLGLIDNNGLTYYFSTYRSNLVKATESGVCLKPGDRVTLKQGCKPLTSFTRDYDWFSPGAAGYVEEVTPSECIIKAVRGGKYVKFKTDPKDLMTLAQG